MSREDEDDEKLLNELTLLRCQFERGVALQSYQHLIGRAYSRILELRRMLDRRREYESVTPCIKVPGYAPQSHS